MKELLADAFPASAWRWGDDYLLEPGRRRLTCRDQPVEVDDRAFDLVVLLLQHRERALDKPEVIAAIWGKRPVSEATLRQLVYKARRAVGDDGERQGVISTLYGRSLQWIAPVEMVFQAGAEIAQTSTLRTVAGDGLPTTEQLPRVAHMPTSMRKRIGLLAFMALAVALVAGGAWFGIVRPRRAAAGAATALPRIAITPVENATDDASLDWVKHGLPGLLGSLLDQGGGVDLVDSAKVVRAWKPRPAQGRDREQQLRFATGAGVVIGAKLSKLSNTLYELNLHVQPAAGKAVDIRVDGDRIGALAANAVLALRRALGLAPPNKILGKLPTNPFLAEAYARGVDLSLRGKYADAISYFTICVNGAPDFLPARFHLGDAQMLTNDSQGGMKTLSDTLAMAQKRDDARIISHVLLTLGLREINRGDAKPAFEYMQRAIPYAQRSGDVENEIAEHVVAAAAADKLNKRDVSIRQLDSARLLVKTHPNLRQAQGMLHDVEGIIAAGRGDMENMMVALRAALALTESLGNERNIVNSMNNLAAGLNVAGRPMDALKTVLPAYLRARQNQYREIEFQAAETLNDVLWKTGLEKQAISASNRLIGLAQRENSKPWQVLVLHHLASAQLANRDAKDALATLRKADALIAPADLSSDLYFETRMLKAMAAFSAEPTTLAGIGEELDGYVAAHATKADSKDSIRPGARRQKLVHALAQAAEAKPALALASLRDAAAERTPGVANDAELREVALRIALAGNDKSAAEIGLNSFDVSRTQNGSLLMLGSRWAKQQGNVSTANQIEVRLAALRKQGLAAIAAAGLDPDNPLGKP